MRIARVTTLYPAYLAAFYQAHPTLETSDYATQAAALAHDAFGWGDAWTSALTPLGHEFLEITANAAPLQRAWAEEQGPAALSACSPHDLVRAQLRSFEPTILWIDDVDSFDADWVRETRRSIPPIAAVAAWCGAPHSGATNFRVYDLVLSNIPQLIEEFDAAGVRAAHLDHAFDHRILERLPAAQPGPDVSFVGQVNLWSGPHLERRRLLAKVGRSVTLHVSTPLQANIRSPRWLLRQARAGARAEGWRALAGAREVFDVLRRLDRPTFGLEMYRLLRDSRVTLNSHISVAGSSANNMRLFEATGVGACLVTDWKPDLGRLFAPGEEVLTYESADECVDVVRWLLERPDEEQRLREAAQKRTLSCHTFEQRAPTLDRLFGELL